MDFEYEHKTLTHLMCLSCVGVPRYITFKPMQDCHITDFICVIYMRLEGEKIFSFPKTCIEILLFELNL